MLLPMKNMKDKGKQKNKKQKDTREDNFTDLYLTSTIDIFLFMVLF